MTVREIKKCTSLSDLRDEKYLLLNTIRLMRKWGEKGSSPGRAIKRMHAEESMITARIKEIENNGSL